MGVFVCYFSIILYNYYYEENDRNRRKTDDQDTRAKQNHRSITDVDRNYARLCPRECGTPQGKRQKVEQLKKTEKPSEVYILYQITTR